MSARIWQGWYSSVRPLITGTREWRAKRSTIACSKVRIITMSHMREITWPASSTGSPRPSCESRVERKIAAPPSWCMPASNDSRVRVDCFSKIITSVRSTSGQYCS